MNDYMSSYRPEFYFVSSEIKDICLWFGGLYFLLILMVFFYRAFQIIILKSSAGTKSGEAGWRWVWLYLFFFPIAAVNLYIIFFFIANAFMLWGVFYTLIAILVSFQYLHTPLGALFLGIGLETLQAGVIFIILRRALRLRCYHLRSRLALLILLLSLVPTGIMISKAYSAVSLAYGGIAYAFLISFAVVLLISERRAERKPTI